MGRQQLAVMAHVASILYQVAASRDSYRQPGTQTNYQSSTHPAAYFLPLPTQPRQQHGQQSPIEQDS